MAILKQDYKAKSSLKVKLSFKEEAVPEHYEDVKNRLEILRYPMITLLSDYL